MNKTPSILSDIVDYKKKVVETLKKSVGNDFFEKELLKYKKNDYSRFKNAIEKKGLSLIAEIKKASPSKGIINHNFKPDQIAQNYISSGARALSILTDEAYFQGSNAILTSVSEQVEIPILRKDFIIDPIQVYEAKVIGADAILIILAILTVDQAQLLLDIAKKCGLDVLIELHDDKDVEKLYQLNGVQLIGINNRNLYDFSVDISRANSYYESLKNDFSSCLFVAESGYETAQQLKKIETLGFNAVLIGEGLVTSSSLTKYFNYES